MPLDSINYFVGKIRFRRILFSPVIIVYLNSVGEQSCSWTSYIHFTIHERIAYNIALPLQEILSGNRDRDLCMKSGLNREWIVDKYYPPLTILRWEGNCVNRPAVPPPFSSSSFFSLLLLLLLFNSRRLIARESFFFTRDGSKHRPRRQTVAGKDEDDGRHIVETRNNTFPRPTRPPARHRFYCQPRRIEASG